MTEINDQLYIEKILKGDVNAFSFLVDNYKNMVFSLAFKMTKSREEAEEVSQDTFIKAYKNLSKFKGDSKFSTWLYRIAYHTSLDAIKRNKKTTNTFDINEVLPAPLGPNKAIISPFLISKFTLSKAL